MAGPRPARIRLTDRLALGLSAMSARPLRALLSVCGIAIGIAALVAVMGVAAAQKASLLAQLEQLGTNLLSVAPGQSPFGEAATLPETAPEMVARLGSIEAEAATYAIDTKVYKNHRIPEAQTSGLTVVGADLTLLEALRAEVAEGQWLTAATSQGPAVVLGAKAAERLAIAQIERGVNVYLGGQWFAVVGVLQPVALAPEIDSEVLMGQPAALQLVVSLNGVPPAEAQLPPGRIYVRVLDGYVEATRGLLGATVNPADTTSVNVSRPSDALAAQATTDASLTTLSYGLGAIGLCVGGIGIANVMVMAVLERRREIGVRRALGATRGGIRGQFLTESVVLGTTGGGLGVLVGIAGAFGFARWQDWPQTVPWPVVGIGLAASVLIGALAGVYPASRAARVSPTEALRTA